MKQFLLTATILCGVYANALGQKSTGVASQTLSIQLGDVIDIKFVANDQAVGPQIQMVFNSAEDYYNGVESPKQILKIRANKNFTVSVRAANVAAQNGNTTVPSFIYIKVPQNNTGGQIAQSFSDASYRRITNMDIPLLEDGDKGDDQTFAVQYKAKPGTMVDPGVYTVDVIFTASRN